MMTTISERTKILIESQNLNEYSFSKRIGKSNTAITKLVKGESKPGYDMLEAIFHEFPNLNREWYLDGSGDIWKKDGNTIAQEEPAGNYLKVYLDRLEEQFKSVLAEKQSVIDDLKTVIKYQRELLDKNRKQSFPKPAIMAGSAFEPAPKNSSARVVA